MLLCALACCHQHWQRCPFFVAHTLEDLLRFSCTFLSNSFDDFVGRFVWGDSIDFYRSLSGSEHDLRSICLRSFEQKRACACLDVFRACFLCICVNAGMTVQ